MDRELCRNAHLKSYFDGINTGDIFLEIGPQHQDEDVLTEPQSQRVSMQVVCTRGGVFVQGVCVREVVCLCRECVYVRWCVCAGSVCT